jgi:AdoMet-dependent rRNA methyltransferase SPB1
MSKRKREKKRSNEKKQKDVLKLQLGMTAPTDLDMTDQALAGEDDIFDLGQGEKEMARKGYTGGDLGNVVLDESGMTSSEEEDQEESEEDDEVLSSDEERERKTKALEGDLDELYDQYRDRMSERDAKWKVKQARMKDKNYDAWHGIKEGGEGSDDDDEEGNGWKDRVVRVQGRGAAEEDSGEESEEGGWDKVAALRAANEGLDSDDSESDVEDGFDREEKVEKDHRWCTQDGSGTSSAWREIGHQSGGRGETCTNESSGSSMVRSTSLQGCRGSRGVGCGRGGRGRGEYGGRRRG